MIPKECKRLAEVDFPIAEVSKHSAREKSIRHGHPSTLHLWWARRPLASCRAVLLGLLLPDPCDPLCPRDFKAKARELLPKVLGSVGAKDEDLRKALLRFIADFANWDLAANKAYLEAARALVKAAYREESPLVVDPFAGGGSIPLEALRLGCEAFASDLNPVACLILKTMLEHIPRHGPQLAEELRRVGGEIKKQAEKELADLYPKDADGATPIAYLWARTVRCEAPNCGAEIPLVRSFWLCKKPKRKRALRYEVHHRDTESTEKIQKHSQCPQCLRGEFPHVEFEIFEPKSERDVPEGTVSRARVKCLCCGTVLPPERVRAQLAAQRGGADVVFHHRDRESTEKNCEETSVSSVPLWCRTGGARLLAVVTLRHGVQGRHYRLPTERDYEAVRKAQVALAKLLDDWESNGRQGLCPVPDEPLPPIGTLGLRVQRYGMLQWGDLFTARQKLALATLSRLVRELTTETQRAQRDSLKEAVRLGMMCAFGIFARSCNTGARLRPDATVAPAFGMHALPMNWGFPETILWGGRSEHFDGAIDTVLEVVEGGLGRVMAAGHVQLADATEHPLPDDAATVWFTDPPYYDAVPYADLSDFFFVWLKRALAGWKPALPFLRDPFDPANPLVPKLREAVQNERSETAEGRAKDKAFYEEAMARAFAEGRRLLREDGVGAVVFAHKTTEGWEALLSGMIRGGWTITGSWPIATEMGSRLRARESAALATSVHLICRPRVGQASSLSDRQDAGPTGDWAEVLRELPKRVGDWMERLQGEGIRGADLVFACIGPALEIFSRYKKVETADGREVKLAEYLEKVWEVVGRTALEQVLGEGKSQKEKGKINGAGGGFEEDARLTALFLWTLQSTNGEETHHRDTESAEEEEQGETENEEDAVPSVSPWLHKGYSLAFDVVRRFAQPLGIDLPKWEGRIIETKKGVVRLLAVSERARQLFGEDGAEAVADWIVHDPQKNLQQVLFPELDENSPQRHRGRRGKKIIIDEQSLRSRRLGGENQATTLDRVHAAMLLQASGQANALRELMKAEQQRGPNFLRLANALSALYPKGSEEKRLLDAMLLAMPR